MTIAQLLHPHLQQQSQEQVQQQMQMQMQHATHMNSITKVVQNINDGVHALQDGDLDIAGQIFTETLRFVRRSLGQLQQQSTAPLDFGAVDSGVLCLPVPVVVRRAPSPKLASRAHSSFQNWDPCQKLVNAASDSPCNHGGTSDGSCMYRLARTVVLPINDGCAPAQGVLESTFHVLTGVLIFDIALLYHIQATQQATDSGKRQHLERSKLLYINAHKLMESSSIFDRKRDIVRLLGIWNNLICVYSRLGDTENTHACSQQVLSILSDPEVVVCLSSPSTTSTISPHCLRISEDRSTVENDIHTFFDHASQKLGNVYARGAPAA